MPSAGRSASTRRAVRRSRQRRRRFQAARKPLAGTTRPHRLVVIANEVLPMQVLTSIHHPADARFQSLLSVAESITSCRELEELFRRLVGQLQDLVGFDFLGLVVYEPERGIARTRVLETASMVLAHRPERAIEEPPAGWVIESQRPLIVPDTRAETRWPGVIAELRQHGIA